MAPQTELIDETGRVVFRGTQSPGGGSQPLADVLRTGNDADGQDIFNVATMSGIDGSGLGLFAGPSEAAAGSPGGSVSMYGQDSDTTPGAAQLIGGNGDGVPGAVASISGGNTSLKGAPAEIVVGAGGDTDGGIDLIANGKLTLDGGAFGRAAHVADGSTVDQLRNALIAAGLMEAS